jgi:hypothetical protein
MFLSRLRGRPSRLIPLAAFAAAAGLLFAVLAPADRAGSAAAVKPGPLYGVLQGKNEIGQDGRKRAGDPDGRGSASAIIDGRQLCFGLTVKNVDQPIAAHIHRGGRGENGPVVVTLVAPSSGDPGASSGCVEISAADANAIRKNPHKYYWNIHTEAFPGGAVRGQCWEKSGEYGRYVLRGGRQTQ